MQLTPTTYDAAASALASASGQRHSIRIIGGGTKLRWSAATEDPDATISTSELDRLLEHNPGDLTAVVQAGAELAALQEMLAAEGQMLALDPPLGAKLTATVGGVFATGDCGPLQHRYGAPREQILGVTVALSDGTIARAGGKVIKNVAGYDLAKLMTGSFGTLGLILAVSVRLHPLQAATATAACIVDDPERIAQIALALSRAPLELQALDVAWRAGRGGLLAQCAGAEAPRRAHRVAKLMRGLDAQSVSVEDDDASLWSRQRAGQRSARLMLARVAARPSALAQVLRAADAAGGTLVGRAALGVSYIELQPDALAGLRAALPGAAHLTLLDRPAELQPWADPHPQALELLRRVKARFDPTETCNPGVFVGGI